MVPLMTLIKGKEKELSSLYDRHYVLKLKPQLQGVEEFVDGPDVFQDATCPESTCDTCTELEKKKGIESREILEEMTRLNTRLSELKNEYLGKL